MQSGGGGIEYGIQRFAVGVGYLRQHVVHKAHRRIFAYANAYAREVACSEQLHYIAHTVVRACRAVVPDTQISDRYVHVVVNYNQVALFVFLFVG